MIYFCGDRITKDLKVELGDFGYQIKQVIVYNTISATSFSHGLLEKLSSNQIRAISFYSKATALSYIELASKHDLKDNHREVEAFALSEQIAAILSQIKWARIYIAAKPTDEKMIELVNSHYEKK